MNVYRDQFCCITLIAGDSQLYLKWEQQPNLKALLYIYNAGMELAVRYSATNWVADNMLGFSFDVSMQRGLAELLARRLPETRITRIARVVPHDIFQELVSHKIMNRLQELLRVELDFKVFSDEREAKAWAAQTTYATRVA